MKLIPRNEFMKLPLLGVIVLGLGLGLLASAMAAPGCVDADGDHEFKYHHKWC